MTTPYNQIDHNHCSVSQTGHEHHLRCCLCYLENSNESKQCEQCKHGCLIPSINDESVCQCECHKPQEWERKFEDKFVAHITSKPGNIEHDRAVIFFEDMLKIKDFIRSELSSAVAKAEQEMARKIGEELPEEEGYKMSSGFGGHPSKLNDDAIEGFNLCLKEVKSIIKKYYE